MKEPKKRYEEAKLDVLFEDWESQPKWGWEENEANEKPGPICLTNPNQVHGTPKLYVVAASRLFVPNRRVLVTVFVTKGPSGYKGQHCRDFPFPSGKPVLSKYCTIKQVPSLPGIPDPKKPGPFNAARLGPITLTLCGDYSVIVVYDPREPGSEEQSDGRKRQFGLVLIDPEMEVGNRPPEE